MRSRCPMRCRRPAGVSERGMVTVELAMVSLLVAGLVGLVAWGWVQLLAFDQCQVAAHEIARQAARSDAEGVRRASAAVPTGATVELGSGAGATVVTVRYVPRLLGAPVGVLDARATVLDEAKP